MSYLKGRNILITGASGFIGTSLVNKLLEEGAIIYSLNPKKRKKTHIKNKENIYDIVCSVDDFAMLSKLLKNLKIDAICHLAAQSLVDLGTDSPISTFKTNIMGTWNILEIARIKKIDKVIVASTTHVYGKNKKLPYLEEFFPQPSRPYETSKACSDLLAQSYADTYGMDITIPRFVNIYGPGDKNFSRLIPTVMNSVIRGKNPRIWDIGAVRDFLYIDDAVDAYIKILKEKPKKKLQIINFGTGTPVKISKIVQLIIKISGKKNTKIISGKIPHTRDEEVLRQYVSIAKAKKLLNWEPRVSIGEGLKTTYMWYDKYFANSI